MKIQKKGFDWPFYKRILLVALPIIIQNGITNFVSLLDNVMVGQVGTVQMSGVAIVNMLLFVFNLCIFGATSGAGIFTAQFHGSGNPDGVRDTFRFKIVAAILLFASCLLLDFLRQTLFKAWNLKAFSVRIEGWITKLFKRNSTKNVSL